MSRKPTTVLNEYAKAASKEHPWTADQIAEGVELMLKVASLDNRGIDSAAHTVARSPLGEGVTLPPIDLDHVTDDDRLRVCYETAEALGMNMQEPARSIVQGLALVALGARSLHGFARGVDGSVELPRYPTEVEALHGWLAAEGASLFDWLIDCANDPKLLTAARFGEAGVSDIAYLQMAATTIRAHLGARCSGCNGGKNPPEDGCPLCEGQGYLEP